eukprot:g1066.t1
MVDCDGALLEVKSLLFWSMLAASTVGPGTVVMCSKSGSTYGLALLWALLVASVVAYTMQEGSARLSIVSGRDFGQAMQEYFGERFAGVCRFLAGGIVLGNLAYQCNNFVGAMASIYLLTPDEPLVRIGGSVALGAGAVAVLLVGRVDAISEALGWVVLLMTGLFAAAAAAIPTAGGDVLQGMFVPSLPQGAGVTVLSLMGTTAIPFNIFLSSSCAEGYTLPAMRRGVAFATLMTLILSSVIVIVGTSVKLGAGELFTVDAIGAALRTALGDSVQRVFAVGLFAAAFSSALAVALGAAIACRSLLAPPPRTAVFAAAADGGGGGEGGAAEDGGAAPVKRRATLRERHPSLVGDNIEREDEGFDWAPQGARYRGVMVALVSVAAIVAAADADTITVVMLAQVVNGCLLPAVATCLLLLLNEPRFVRARPQTTVENALLLAVVAMTIFTASFAVAENLMKLFFGPRQETDEVLDNDTALFVVAGAATVLLWVPLCVNTVRKASAAAADAAARAGDDAGDDDAEDAADESETAALAGGGGTPQEWVGREGTGYGLALTRREDSIQADAASYGATA